MMDNRALGLIVARPGRIRDAWRALLRASCHIDIVDQADDGPSALRTMAELPPALVLLDADLPGDEAHTVLRQIKARWPHIRCILLISNGEHRQLADANGVDAVLVKGFSMVALSETIAKLLPPIEQMTGGD
ncbi:MAG: response regulator [Anaerolineae bacterium]|nr:response regulator [Anaerolineae bacterium]